MSHIVRIQTQVRNPQAIAAACTRLNLPAPTVGEAKLYSGRASGTLVQLPDWLYPLVINTDSGEVQFDNMEGSWGNPVELDRFKQAYAIEVATLEARRKGHQVSEQPLSDGSVKLTIRVA